MSDQLTKLQKQLCDLLQGSLPLHSRPFAEIAKALDSEEQIVLKEIAALKSAGVIRRIGPVINYLALGRTGTLAVAHVPQDSLPQIAEAINSLENVSHNYLRQHHYNLWFTLQGNSERDIELTLSNLAARFDIDFHSLAARRTFKLDVRFDTESDSLTLCDEVADSPPSEAVVLNAKQKLVLSKLQKDFAVTERPFESLCEPDIDQADVLETIAELIDKGVIRRLAGIVDHRKLGFIANVLFACEVPQERIIDTGAALARFRAVSHCYERETFPRWPYNLFAMMHAKSMGEIQRIIDRFTDSQKTDSFELLPTTAELKKQPIRYDL